MIAGGQSGFVRLQELTRSQAVFFTLVRLPAAGGVPAGTYDTTPGSPYFGTYLHLRCNFPVVQGTSLIDTNNPEDVPPVYEWDPCGLEVFPPKCTDVFLVGGAGRWGVKAEWKPIACDDYGPRKRRLMRFLAPGDIFVVPPGHGAIGTLNPTAVLTNLNDGNQVILVGGYSFPTIAGTAFQNPLAPDVPLQVWTEFYQ